VIIPTYQRAHSILEAVESARGQSYPNTQIIVIDDGSTDGTGELLAAAGDVEYHHQPNRGQGAARNAGLRHARGEYVASLDSDDLWDEDFLSSSVAELERSGLDFVFSNWRDREGHPSRLRRWIKESQWREFLPAAVDGWPLLSPEQNRMMFLTTCYAPTSAFVLRRDSIVSGWGEEVKIADDWYLILEMVLTKPIRSAFTLRPMWTKRMDGKNISDGIPFSEYVRKVRLSDEAIIVRDLRDRMTPVERRYMARRTAEFRVIFVIARFLETRVARRLGLRSVVRMAWRGRQRASMLIGAAARRLGRPSTAVGEPEEPAITAAPPAV
jgi:glycosyltransferase involved in cell wall biosynthesis